MSESQLIPSPTPNSNNDSPQWSRSTKVIVTVVALLLVVWITYRFQSLIGQVVAAAILAYILNPIIIILDKRTPLHRSNAILIMYLLLLIGFIGAVTALGVAAFEQVSTLISAVPTFIEETTELVQSSIATFNPVKIGPIIINPNEFDWNILTDQILGMVEPVVSRSGQIVTDIATTTVGWVGTLFFVFVISIYFAIEIPQLGGYVGRLANQPGYRKDAERLMRNFGSIWSAYLRGQVILGLIIFVVVWVGLAILGVQNSLALGILSGLLEFIPVIGPVVGAGAAMIVAFFQPDNYMALSPLAHTGIVFFYMILVQQLENNLLVPRIVGESLDLHPLIVMVGVFMGSSLAGILGAILAAPVVATLKMLGVYAWRKMFDLPPFSDLEAPPVERISVRERAQGLLQKVKRKP